MATNNLSSSSLAIEKFVTTMGSATIGQILRLFPGIKFETVRFYIMALIKKQRVRIINDKYIIPAIKKEVDYGAVDSIWVLLDRFKGLSIHSDEIQLAFGGESPIKLCFMDQNILYEVMPLDKYTMGNINYIIERDSARSEALQDFTKYIFVIKDMDTLDRLAEYNLTIPHVVCLVEDTGCDEPPKCIYYGQN